MVQMLFYLRFRSQLRRTRPDLVTRLDETITGAIFTAGGRLSDNRRFLNASFDSDRIGFWLDILILIETILKALENAGSELSGHAMILSQNIPEHEAERLCLTLSSSAAASHTGIWCGQAVRDSLQPYCIFENPFRGYVELENLIPFNNSESGFFPYREKIAGVLAGAKKGENTLLLGSVTGIRDGVYRYCTSAMKDAPPLVIRFSTGDCGPGCLCDALTPAIREYLASSSKNSPAEMETLAQLLFRERLRDQVSPFLIEAAKRFLELLLKSFRTAASGRHSRVFVILEDLFDSGSVLAGIIRDTLSLQENRNDFVYIAYGCGDSKEFREWNTVFTRVIKLAGKDFPAAREDLPKLSADLLEMMYTFTLLRRFFPPALFPQLFEEEGLNPGIPDKAVQLLLSIGAMDFLPDPRPCLPEFLKTPEKIAGEAGIKKMVCSRLLAWEKEGRIRPCFNLLRILHELGAVIDDPLILRVLRGEIDNGTSGGMEAAFSGGQIGQMTNRENIKILNWIFNARKALVSYVQNEIHGIFSRPSPVLPASVYQGFRAELLSNLSAYRLGCRDSGAASETVRELMLVNQNLKDGGIPSYRYFSLVNLLRLKIDDTLEYGSFAMELAEKTGNGEELVKASFFTAASGFLNGDLSLAQKLTVKTEKTALDLGWVEWALRSRFFLGRIFFEQGHYQDALNIFISLEGKVPPQADGTLEAWIYRARIYLAAGSHKKQKKPIEQPDLSSGDGRLFSIEAAYLLGNYEDADRLGNEFLSGPDEGEDFFYTEQPDWRSGFSQCEYMVLPEKILRNRLITVYRLMAQSSLPFTPENAEALRSRIQRLVREELLADGDPGDVFCLYAWYLINRRTGASHGDVSTAVSMAYRRLQRRSSRIDSAGERQDYVSMNYWNNALSLAARENKLV